MVPHQKKVKNHCINIKQYFTDQRGDEEEWRRRVTPLNKSLAIDLIVIFILELYQNNK